MFVKNNEGFVCLHCGREVKPHPTSSRNHCNFCLYSRHVDIDPGDRLSKCGGLMKPLGLLTTRGRTKILFKCESCGFERSNVLAPDDNSDKIVEVSTKVI